MRREDIELRTAARNGDAQASLSIAEKLLAGSDGFPRNPQLGLAYLQQELASGSAAAFLLAARAVPLELIVAHRLRGALEFAAGTGCPVARFKLKAWSALRGETGNAEEVAALLREAPATVLDAVGLTTLCAREALAARDVLGACLCIRIASAFASPEALADVVCRTVYLAATQPHALGLPTAVVEGALHHASRQGDHEAQYALGCGFAGLGYGMLEASALVRGRSVSKAAGLLLRAAEGGRPQAWLNLFEIIPASKGAIASHDVARFFLEKAARSGLVEAQMRLGVLLLAEATCLRGAEEALQWLSAAHEAGDCKAQGVLATLVLPIAQLPPEYEKTILEKISARDRDLGIRLSLARALHLTRHEALSFNPARDLRAWGLVLPGSSKENPRGRVAPAVSATMKAELWRAKDFYRDASPLEATFVLRRARAQKVLFTQLSISQELFFAADIGRSCSHYGYGKHWHARATGQKSRASRASFDALSTLLSPSANATPLR
jgi:hypothetical protein